MSLDEARALDAADPLRGCRDRFSLPDGILYLDGNSLGALPKAALAQITRTVEMEWGGDLIASWNKHGWIDWPTRIAARLAPIVGASADELLVCDSTSVNLFKLLGAALEARSTRKVILSEQGNFPTDLYIAQGLHRLTGSTLRTVAAADLEEALTDDVAVMMLTHVDYRSGRRHDMSALSAAAHKAGALSLWDLSHSAGAIMVDLAASGADLAVGCGYKYLNGGPGAPAWLYVRRDLHGELTNPLSGWMGHAEPFAFTADYRPTPGIARFLTGTPPIVALAALEAGLETFEGIAVADIEAKAASLTGFFIDAVEALAPELKLASPREAGQRGSHVVWAHDAAYAIIQALIARGIIGDFREPNLLRFGFAALYNSHEEAWRAAETVRDVMSTGEWDQRHFHARARVT